MKKINVILLMAGKGERANLTYNKVFYEVNKIKLYMYSLKKFLTIPNLNKLYLVVNQDDYEIVLEDVLQNEFLVSLIIGGKTRAESVRKALSEVGNEYDVLIHDAARPLTSIVDINNLINSTNSVGTLYHKVVDTIKLCENGTTTINREMLKAVTTPQYFHKDLIDKIVNNKIDYTDELQIFEDDYSIDYILETSFNPKLTKHEDLAYISYLLNPTYQLVGHSYDFHPFEENRPLILGGVRIPYEKGLKGHSDADSLYHAVAEAIMGACSLGDLGTLFPDSDMKYKDLESSYFVKEVIRKLDEKNLKVFNIDAIIYAEAPKLVSFKNQMAQNIKQLTQSTFVNVKATTMEKCGLVGEKEGIGCEVVCLITNK